MRDRTEREYRVAEGRCLAAVISLRRFDSAEAIRDLKSAIRIIEAEKARAQREDVLRYNRVIPANVPTLAPDDF